MPRYLIQVSQPAKTAAKRIATSICASGSHFATHACWQQQDGMATGTLVVDVDDRTWALGVVPPSMRSGASIFELSTANIGQPPRMAA
jgi:hypothetical protein